MSKGTRQFRTTQALVFGIGIFLGKCFFVQVFFTNLLQQRNFFIAWLAGLLQIVSGALMACSACSGDEDQDYQSDYGGYNAGNNIVNNYGNTQRSDNSRKQFV